MTIHVKWSELGENFYVTEDEKEFDDIVFLARHEMQAGFILYWFVER